MLFKDLCKEYEKAKTEGAYRTKTVRLNTWEGYRSAIDTHLLPKWGDREVESITYDEVQEWIDDFGKGAEKAFKTLRGCLRWSLTKLHLRFADPTIGVDVPKPERREGKVLNAQKLNSLLYKCKGKPWEPVVWVQAAVGLRRCEAVALTWGDLDLGKGTVSITKGRHVVGGEVYVWGTKTQKSRRKLVLPWFVVERLRQIRKERRARPDELLCDMRPDAISRQFRSWCNRNGFKGFTMMQIRHTFATIAVKAGIRIEVVAMMLGHSDLTMCFTRYVQSSVDLFRAQIKKWSEAVLHAAPAGRADEVDALDRMWEPLTMVA